jgi:hypothetical protein
MKRTNIIIIALIVSTVGFVGFRFAGKRSNAPRNDRQKEVVLTFTGTCHEDEVNVHTGEVLYGLYENADGYELIPSKITVSDAEDGITPEDKTITVNHPGKPLLLVKNIPGLVRRNVKTVFSGISMIHPSETIALKLSDTSVYYIDYLQETKESKKDHILTITLRCNPPQPNGRDTQTVATIRFPGDDSDPALLWAGDLDGDGKLDMMFNLTEHYNVSNIVLFLSSMAEPGKLVKQAATRRTVGC